jgi:hypothetical protein
MSCDGGHLGFPIGIKNSNLVKDIPMIIPLQFGFSQFISFGEEDLWNFGQSEHIIGPGSHIEYPTGTFLLSSVPIGQVVSEKKLEMWKVYRRQTTDDRWQTTDDGRQVMAIVHMDLWSRWTNNNSYQYIIFYSIWNMWPIWLSFWGRFDWGRFDWKSMCFRAYSFVRVAISIDNASRNKRLKNIFLVCYSPQQSLVP